MKTLRINKKLFLLFFIVVMSASLTLLASQKPINEKEIPRKILAFYDPVIEKEPFFTNIHQIAEMPLNHLGLMVEYRSILDPLPPSEFMEGYRGVITWFSKEKVMENGDDYCRWLLMQMSLGKKVVILEAFGFAKDAYGSLSETCHKAFKRLGGDYRGEKTSNPFFIEFHQFDTKMMEFERKLSLIEEPKYTLIKPTSKDVKPYLILKRNDIEDNLSTVVFVSNHGGYVHSSYAIYENLKLKKRHWRLNPFLFFSEAFDVKTMPKPDTTTMNGNRIYYSHIDGDGLFNISHLDKKSFSIEVIYEKILLKYPSLPITASLVAFYFDNPSFQGERVQNIYKKIFQLNNIEAASHSYAHPLNWQKGEISFHPKGYQFKLDKEIAGSMQMINRMLKQLHVKKAAKLFLWTGDYLPTRSQIQHVANRGFLQMNGGKTRFDHKYDSYSFVWPLGLSYDGVRQIYASNSNENIYTNFWQGPYYEFRSLTETFENTEHPIRIKPINIYYHYYSGERLATIKALERAYDYVLNHDVFALFGSEYPPIVDGFYTTQIYQNHEGYSIRNSGELKTIRFDHEDRNLDLSQSKGVIGFSHYQKNLYVYLDEGNDHYIQLTHEAPRSPYVINSNFNIRKFQQHDNSIFFQKKGWNASEMKLGGVLPNQLYSVQAGKERQEVTSDTKGMLPVIFNQAENGKAYQDVLVEVQL